MSSFSRAPPETERRGPRADPIFPHRPDDRAADCAVIAEERSERRNGPLVADFAEGVNGREAEPGIPVEHLDERVDGDGRAHVGQAIDDLLGDVDVVVVEQRDEVRNRGWAPRAREDASREHDDLSVRVAQATDEGGDAARSPFGQRVHCVVAPARIDVVGHRLYQKVRIDHLGRARDGAGLLSAVGGPERLE